MGPPLSACPLRIGPRALRPRPPIDLSRPTHGQGSWPRPQRHTWVRSPRPVRPWLSLRDDWPPPLPIITRGLHPQTHTCAPFVPTSGSKHRQNSPVLSRGLEGNTTGDRGDTPPARLARPLAGLTSGRSGPPLISLLRREEERSSRFSLWFWRTVEV